MSDLDGSGTSTGRLRRRSFFENMEPEASSASSSASAMDTIPLHDAGDSAPSGDDGASTPLLSGSSADGSADGSPGGAAQRQGVLGLLGRLLRLVFTKIWFLKSWFIVKLQALGVNARLARTLRRGRSADKVSSTTETLVVKQYAYPTHWIKLACFSLVVFQYVIYTYFLHDPLSLHVEECVFHEKMLPAGPARERILAVGAGGAGGGDGHLLGAASNVAAIRFLERRFELQNSPVALAQHNNLPRLPWTCISIVPTLKVVEDDEKDTEVPSVEQVLAKQAKDLSLLLPRSQIVKLGSTSGVSSRLHLALGTGAPIVRGESTGVLAAMFPLSTFRENLFPEGFPDMILVKSEYALKKLVLFRHERQEEFQHRLNHDDDGAVDTAAEGGEDTEEHRRLRHEKSKTQYGVFLLKTTVPDIYDRHIRKNWDAFLHVVVTTEQDKKEQLTKEILALWVHHPEWPTLHVRFQQSLTLCSSFVRYLSTIRQVTGDDAEIVDHDERPGDQKAPANIDLTCAPADNTRSEIIRLKNKIGIHLFPVPPEMEVYEDQVLESAAAGAIVITYNTPIMHEWITDACGVRVGTFENAVVHGEDGDNGLLELPEVRVTSGEIERAVEGLLKLDRVHRVAAGRAARVRYLSIRTHYLSAIAALDTAICDFDMDDSPDQQNEIGQRSRKKVDVDALRVFLY